jgi:hypothetical protein
VIALPVTLDPTTVKPSDFVVILKGLRSLDNSSIPSTANSSSVAVRGTWGYGATEIRATITSLTSLACSFKLPSEVAKFKTEFCDATAAASCQVTVTEVESPLVSYSVHAAAVLGGSYSVFVTAWDHWTNQYGQRLQGKPSVVKLLLSSIGSVQGGERLSSVGGVVRITGTNFGSADSVISAVFFNDTSEQKTATCVTGVTYADCTAQAGVGRNYVWRLIVDGLPGTVSTDMTHYAPPAVNDLTGPGQNSASKYVDFVTSAVST